MGQIMKDQKENLHHGGTSVECISSSDDISSRLQNVFMRYRSVAQFSENRENGSDRDEAVDVGGSVQRIKGDDVFSGMSSVNFDVGFVLLRNL